MNYMKLNKNWIGENTKSGFHLRAKANDSSNNTGLPKVTANTKGSPFLLDKNGGAVMTVYYIYLAGRKYKTSFIEKVFVCGVT